MIVLLFGLSIWLVILALFMPARHTKKEKTINSTTQKQPTLKVNYEIKPLTYTSEEYEAAKTRRETAIFEELESAAKLQDEIDLNYPVRKRYPTSKPKQKAPKMVMSKQGKMITLTEQAKRKAESKRAIAANKRAKTKRKQSMTKQQARHARFAKIRAQQERNGEFSMDHVPAMLYAQKLLNNQYQEIANLKQD